MNNQLQNVKEQFMRENTYYDKIFLSEEECDKINNMDNTDRSEYIKEHNLYTEISSAFNNEYKYYKIQYWNVSDEELILLTSINNSRKINTIKKIMIFILLLLGLPLLFYITYTSIL